MKEANDNEIAIVDLFTREPWVPKELSDAEVERVDGGPAIDHDAIKILKMVLGDLESGKATGVAVMTFRNATGHFNVACALPNTDPTRTRTPAETSLEAFTWSGGLNLLDEAILDMAMIAGDYEGAMSDDADDVFDGQDDR